MNSQMTDFALAGKAGRLEATPASEPYWIGLVVGVDTTDVPHEDWAISQKLLLEADEPAFLKLANETRAA